MDHQAEVAKRIRETKTPKALVFTGLVKYEHPGLSDRFLHILSEYTNARIDYGYMFQQVSTLFSSHPEVVRLFYACFPQAKRTKNVNVHDSDETLGPAKKAKIEDDSRIAITEFGPTSNASTSCASDCTPGNAAEINEVQKEKTAQWRGRTLYVTETETKIIEGLAYQHFTELMIEMSADRIDIYSIMERASKSLQGYPEMIESFNTFLPDGYRIVILSDDHEMSTD